MTKQRLESTYDIVIKDQMLNDLNDIIPDQLKGNKIKVIMQHFNEAWRVYKATGGWSIPQMPEKVHNLITFYINI